MNMNRMKQLIRMKCNYLPSPSFFCSNNTAWSIFSRAETFLSSWHRFVPPFSVPFLPLVHTSKG